MREKNMLNLFIAAAGFGSRLRPLSEKFPKPLLPVAGLSVVDRLCDNLKSSSLQFDNFAMNVHHLPKAFDDWASQQNNDFPAVTLFR